MKSFLRYSAVAVFSCGLLFLSAVPARPDEAAPMLLSAVQKDVQAALDGAASGVTAAAEKLAGADLAGAESRKVLKDACALDASAVDCALLDGGGLVLSVEPAWYGKLVGVNLGAQPHVARLLLTKKPVLSAPFRTVEGFDGVALQHPVLDGKGGLRGAVSLLMRPESLLLRVAGPRTAGTPFALWAVDTSGRVLYDADPAAIGRDLPADPAYADSPSLLGALKKIVAGREGTVRYALPGQGAGSAEAHWATVSLWGTEWRIVLTHALASSAKPEPQVEGKLGLVLRGDSLRDWAEDPALIAAMKAGDLSKVASLFRRFYDANPGIYSVQWVDPAGVNRTGYPTENSLIGYDFRDPNAVGATGTLKALDGRKETLFEEPLIEGRTGRFHFVPVFDQQTYLGMIYTIRIKA